MNNTSLTNEQVKQIAEYFEVEDIEEIEELSYETYGLINLEIEGQTYVVAEDYDQAEKAAGEAIRSLFDEIPTGFSAWVLCDNMPNEVSLESVENLIENELDEVIRELVDVKGLIDDCIGMDGIGHQLASYDGEEIRVEDMHLYRTD